MFLGLVKQSSGLFKSYSALSDLLLLIILK